MSKGKRSGLSTLLYTFGTLIIAVFVVIVGINFARDARIFQKPALSTSDGQNSGTQNADGYKTLRYKKPADVSTKQSEKQNTPAKPASAAKPSETTKTQVKNPVPTAEP